jgi:uncharacterized protein YcbK (DUF882 family)
VRPLTTLQSANEELRQARRELAQSGKPPLRLVIAGDPTKPVFSITVPRRLPAIVGAIVGIAAAATAFSGWGGPAKALAALSSANLYAAPLDDSDGDHASGKDPALSASAQVEAVPPTVHAHSVPEKEHFTVEMFNTGKIIEVHLGGPGGEPDEASYRALRHELRDPRSGAESPIDPRLIEILHQISLSTGERIQVVSAFRGLGPSGDFNYHVRGMATDIKVPGVSTEDLRDLAKSLGATGVGYYPTVQFVHVDVRSTPYFWTDTSGHGEHGHAIAGFIAVDPNDKPQTAAAEAAQPIGAEQPASPAQSDLSAEVAAILRPPGVDTSANVPPVAPLVVPTAAPMVVPAAVPAGPRAKSAPGVEQANLPAKARTAAADEPNKVN